MQPALAQICTLNSPFEADVADYAAGHCPAIELWLGKLETYLKTHSPDDVRQLLAEHKLVAPVASFQGGLFDAQDELRKAHWDDFARRLELCQTLGVETLVLAFDLVGQLSQRDLDRAVELLGQAALQAGRHRLRLALEFQAHATFGNNLQTAAALVAQTASPHLGLCLDVFHYYTGPSKAEDLNYLTPQNLFHVQLSDLADTARELATDANRILPGEGDIPLAPILDRLRAINYRGYVSIELMNPQVWQVPALQFGEIATTALRKLLGQAER
jgi:sugar phosphate isomerase/epimerase